MCWFSILFDGCCRCPFRGAKVDPGSCAQARPHPLVWHRWFLGWNIVSSQLSHHQAPRGHSPESQWSSCRLGAPSDGNTKRDAVMVSSCLLVKLCEFMWVWGCSQPKKESLRFCVFYGCYAGKHENSNLPLAPHFLVRGVGHAISWWLLESMMNFDEPSHEQTSPTVESVCSSIRMLRHLPPLVKTRDRVPETGFGQVFFFNGNFKHQNNSCVHKGHKGHKQSKQAIHNPWIPRWNRSSGRCPQRPQSALRVPIS